MGPQFFETNMGRTFYDGTLPRLVKAIDRLAKAIEDSNALKTEGRETSKEETKEE